MSINAISTDSTNSCNENAIKSAKSFVLMLWMKSQTNWHQKSLKSRNYNIMQKHEWLRCKNSNSMIHGRKCEIGDSNHLRNIQGWWTKPKNKSKSANHAKFKWNSVSMLNVNEKIQRNVNWWNGDGIGCVMVRNAW